MKINAVVFDMDGLLVDTEPLWKIAETELIESRGGVFVNEIRNQIIGLRMKDIVAHFQSIYRFRDHVQTLENELEARMIHLITHHLSPKAGAENLVKGLFDNGIPCAIASSSPKTLIEAVVAQQEWERYFQYRCSAEDEINGKPAPDVYHKACHLLGKKPEDCLALEDSLNGAKAAAASGMVCFVVPSSGTYPDPAFDELEVKQYKNLQQVGRELGV